MKNSLSLFVLLLLFASCQATEQITETSNNTLYSTLWIQTSAEYEALSYQAYNTSSALIETALDDSMWTASLEQGNSYTDLPPAIILDLDETAMDNSFYEARGIIDQTGFDPETWNAWVTEEEAEAIKGAVELTTGAADLGVEVFYVTNRDAAVQESTEANLRELGFPVAEGSVMSNGGRPEWTSAKTERRKLVAGDYRILMLFGDDLNDFLPAREISIEERKQLVEEHRNKWGVKWFVLPNPNYGSWERALYYGDEESEEEQQQTRLDQLETKRD
ncbi:MAG: HAD family acid phosphatase [Balneolaceae bacterium]